MRNQIATWLLAGILSLGAGPAWAQDASTPVVETPAPAAAPAAEVPPAQDVNVNIAPPPAVPDVNVRVEAPAAPPSTTTVIERPGSTKSTSSNTSVTEKTTVQQPAQNSPDPLLFLGIGLGVLFGVVLLVAAVSGSRKSKSTVTTVT